LFEFIKGDTLTDEKGNIDFVARLVSKQTMEYTEIVDLSV